MSADDLLNGTTALGPDGGVLSTALGAIQSSSVLYAGIAGAAIVFLLLSRLIGPDWTPDEPPLLKPTIPLVGHIIDMIRLQKKFAKSLMYVFPASGARPWDEMRLTQVHTASRPRSRSPRCPC